MKAIVEIEGLFAPIQVVGKSDLFEHLAPENHVRTIAEGIAHQYRCSGNPGQFRGLEQADWVPLLIYETRTGEATPNRWSVV